MSKARKGAALKSAPKRANAKASSRASTRTVPKPVALARPKAARPPAKPKPAPIRAAVPIPEVVAAIEIERPLTPDELWMERDRIYARIVSIPNVISRPSPADYVVFEVADPSLVHRRLVAAGIPADTVQKYPKLPNGMRVLVRSAKRNEAFLRALELAVK